MTTSPPPAPRADGASREEWDRTTAAFRSATARRVWRDHCDWLHRELLARSWPAPVSGRVLKTDLFDESAGTGLAAPLAAGAGEVHGIDLSGAVATAAAASHPDVRAVLADVRALPYPDGTFERVVSNSTLDHFSSVESIRTALRELHRVTVPGGELLVTMDNLANPVIRLRAAVPQRWLRAMRLVPYFVGVTVDLRGLEHEVRRAGFEVVDTDVLMHVPRVLAIPLCGMVDRVGADAWGDRAARWLERAMRCFERLGRWPTRRWTAYYVAVRAVRSSEGEP